MDNFSNALWHISADRSVIQQEVLTTPAENDLLIQTYYSLISQGTERLVSMGRVPQSLHQAMRVPYMDGTFEFPVKYGYSVVGKVISPGPHKDRWVFLMHPHQEVCVVRQEDVKFVPKGIHPRRAVLFPTMETVLNAVWDGEVEIGDKVLIMGFGLVGSLLWRLLKNLPGIDLRVAEISPWRRNWAKSNGVILWQDTDKEVFDVIFNTSANAEALQLAIDHSGLESKIIELSWYGITPSTVYLGGSFHIDRKQIISSQVAKLPSRKLHRWSEKRRCDLVWHLLKDPTIDDHLTHEIKFNNLPSVFTDLREKKMDFLTFLVKYNE